MKTNTETIVLLDPKKVLVSKKNTRQPKASDVAELMQSIRESGQITPALVRPHPTKEGHYELAAGARRKVACDALKRPLRAVIRAIEDDELEDLILIENLQREDPDPMQEAQLIQRRIAAGVAPSEIAARYGKSETWLKRRMKLASLTSAARDAWGEGGAFSHFSTEMMEFIGTLPAADQDALADDPWECREFGSLKELVDAHNRLGHDLEKAEWLNDPASFIDGCGPGCSNNSNDSLFPDPDSPCGRCLNPDCFNSRLSKLRESRIADIIQNNPLDKFTLICSDGYAHRDIQFMGTTLNILPTWQYREDYKKIKKPTEKSIVGIDFKDPMNPVRVHLLPIGKTLRKGPNEPAKSKQDSREDRLTGKRLAAIHAKILAALEQTPVETITARFPILNLVAAFGTDSSRRHCFGDTDHTAAWGSLYAESAVDHLNEYHEEPVSRETALWHTIRPILRQRITTYKNSDLLPEHKQHELRQLAALIGFPWASTWETICRTEVPPPKSWGPGIDPITLQLTAKTKAA